MSGAASRLPTGPASKVSPASATASSAAPKIGCSGRQRGRWAFNAPELPHRKRNFHQGRGNSPGYHVARTVADRQGRPRCAGCRTRPGVEAQSARAAWTANTAREGIYMLVERLRPQRTVLRDRRILVVEDE